MKSENSLNAPSKKVLRTSIDLGTNTCLLLIVEWNSADKTVSQVVGDFATIVRLGEGVDQARKFAESAMERTLACLKDYSQKVIDAGLKPSETLCVATSQARDSKNSEEFFAKVQSLTGFSFRVITGDEEAQATFRGTLLPGMSEKTSVVIDIGGGSTEIISETDGQSIDIGAVRFTERFLKVSQDAGVCVTDQEFWDCQYAIDAEIEKAFGSEAGSSAGSALLTRFSKGQLVAVAGTATTLAAWHLELRRFDAEEINALTLTRGDIHRMVEELKWRTVQERAELPGLEPKRADVILAGALILWRTMELLGFTSCRISTRGLRFGVLAL